MDLSCSEVEDMIAAQLLNQYDLVDGGVSSLAGYVQRLVKPMCHSCTGSKCITSGEYGRDPVMSGSYTPTAEDATSGSYTSTADDEQQAEQQQDEWKEKLDAAQADAGAKQQQIDDLGNSTDSQVKQLKFLSGQETDLSNQVDELNEELDEAQSEAGDTQQQLHELNSKLASKEDELKKAEEDTDEDQPLLDILGAGWESDEEKSVFQGALADAFLKVGAADSASTGGANQGGGSGSGSGSGSGGSAVSGSGGKSDGRLSDCHPVISEKCAGARETSTDNCQGCVVLNVMALKEAGCSHATSEAFCWGPTSAPTKPPTTAPSKSLTNAAPGEKDRPKTDIKTLAEKLDAAREETEQQLTTTPPITAPPSTAPPTTAPPTSMPKATTSPTHLFTAPPTTAPPTTAPPTTAPPTTAPPTTTVKKWEKKGGSMDKSVVDVQEATGIDAAEDQHPASVNDEKEDTPALPDAAELPASLKGSDSYSNPLLQNEDAPGASGSYYTPEETVTGGDSGVEGQNAAIYPVTGAPTKALTNAPAAVGEALGSTCPIDYLQELCTGMDSTDECYWCIESACSTASLDDFMFICEEILPVDVAASATATDTAAETDTATLSQKASAQNTGLARRSQSQWVVAGLAGLAGIAGLVAAAVAAVVAGRRLMKRSVTESTQGVQIQMEPRGMVQLGGMAHDRLAFPLTPAVCDAI
jgi:hypothetical protein